MFEELIPSSAVRDIVIESKGRWMCVGGKKRWDFRSVKRVLS